MLKQLKHTTFERIGGRFAVVAAKYNGRYVDANRIMYVGKVETYPRLDDEGNDAGVGYAVYLGTDLPRDQQISVTGTKEEILALLKTVLGVTSA